MEAVNRIMPSSSKALKVWGRGSFENDGAVRWVEALEDAIDLEHVEASLEDVIEADEEGLLPDATESTRALAAAETVAVLAEKASKQLPEEVRQWCFDNPSFDLSEVQLKAVQALGVVLQGSWIRSFFDEHGEAEDWETEVEDLRDRLRS